MSGAEKTVAMVSMAVQIPTQPNDVLDLWLGTLDSGGCAAPEKVASWWKKDPGFDTRVRDDFAATHAALMAGNQEWLTTTRGVLAVVIVLDQFSRNMYRGTARMYEGDAAALELARVCIAAGGDVETDGEARSFIYMPFMHSEALADQEACVRLFSAFCDAATGELEKRLANNVKYAIAHRDIVERFGRFPHRNEILERVSTPEEISFLKEPGSAF